LENGYSQLRVGRVLENFEMGEIVMRMGNELESGVAQLSNSSLALTEAALKPIRCQLRMELSLGDRIGKTKCTLKR
jgi:hypothetical protein